MHPDVHEMFVGGSPDSPGNQAYEKLVKPFRQVFTLNHDLILYWLIQPLSSREEYEFMDGFRKRNIDGNLSFDPEKYKESEEEKRIHYLHGGLHLFKDEDSMRKLVRGPVGDLMSAIKGYSTLPILVLDGDSRRKMEAIYSNVYLRHCFDSLRNIKGTLVSYGCSFGQTDSHIMDAILDNKKVERIYISYHESSDPLDNMERMRERKIMLAEEKIERLKEHTHNSENKKDIEGVKLKLELERLKKLHIEKYKSYDNLYHKSDML